MVTGPASGIVHLNRQIEGFGKAITLIQGLNRLVGIIQFVFITAVRVDGQGAVLSINNRSARSPFITLCGQYKSAAFQHGMGEGSSLVGNSIIIQDAVYLLRSCSIRW